MSIKVLRTINAFNKNGSKAMTTTPLLPQVQKEIDAGNLITTEVRCGPLGLKDGSLFLSLTATGLERLNVPVSKPKCEHDLADVLWSASTHYPRITDYE